MAVLESLFVAALGLIAAAAPPWGIFAFFERMGLLTAVPGFDGFTLSPAALLSAVATAVACGLTTGVASEWSGTSRLAQSLNESSYSLSRPARLTTLLATVQVGVTFALLVAGGGFALTLQRVLAVDHGMDLVGLYAFSFQPERNRYAAKETRRLYREVLAGVNSRPQVSGAAWVQLAPFDGARRPLKVRLRRLPPAMPSPGKRPLC